MATQIEINVSGNFLEVYDDGDGSYSYLPLSNTAYQIFQPQQLDSSSPDGKIYLFFTNINGNKTKFGGWDILTDECNYDISSTSIGGNFRGLPELTNFLNSVLATPTTSPYKVFTALLTQSGNDTEDSINSGDLTIGVTYSINQESLGMDFTNVGAPDNVLGTTFIATGITPNSWGDGADYTLSYSAGAPVANVLDNTIGNIWFTYGGTGFYRVNSSGLFKTNKITVNSETYYNGSADAMILMFPNRFISENEFSINTWGIQSAEGINDVLSCQIEIRVYN